MALSSVICGTVGAKTSRMCILRPIGVSPGEHEPHMGQLLVLLALLAQVVTTMPVTLRLTV